MTFPNHSLIDIQADDNLTRSRYLSGMTHRISMVASFQKFRLQIFCFNLFNFSDLFISQHNCINAGQLPFRITVSTETFQKVVLELFNVRQRTARCLIYRFEVRNMLTHR